MFLGFLGLRVQGLGFRALRVLRFLQRALGALGWFMVWFSGSDSRVGG